MTLVISSHRKTRKGTIVKIVREHYLRDDIHCGLRSCSACKRFKLDPRDKFAPPFYLSENPRSGISSLFPAPHYLVVDASLLTSQIDLICDDNFGEDILILQTVWKEVKPNIPVFSKLQEAMASKRIYLFDNEHNRESFRCVGRWLTFLKQVKLMFCFVFRQTGCDKALNQLLSTSKT